MTNFEHDPQDDLTQQQREAFTAAWNARPWYLHDPTDKEIAEYWFKQGLNSTPVPETPFAWYRKIGGVHGAHEMLFASEYDGPPPDEQGWIPLYALTQPENRHDK